MKIALYGRPFSSDCNKNITAFFHTLEENKTELYIFAPFLEFLNRDAGITPSVTGTFESHDDIPHDVQLMFSMGGDGTFLKTVAIIQDSGIPIAGINTGRLGFLANIPQENITSSIPAILQGHYSIEHRTLIRLELSEGTLDGFSCALNEVSIQKKYSSMITIHTYLDDVLLNSYWADGLIISTPTGSTAYSMSVGGPIVTPDSNNFIISPLAPHNLTIRPIVVPDNNIIKLKVDSRDSCFNLSIDSRSEIFKTNLEILIRRAEFTIKTIRTEGHTFYDNLRNKLMWGLDRRN
jgi:NAD+ kinase